MQNLPTREKNTKYRSREYLTATEVKTLLDAVKSRSKHPARDYALVLLMFRHGLRASEAINLRWDAVMLERQEIFINRLKGSEDGTHVLQNDEIECLKTIKALYPGYRHIFVHDRVKQRIADKKFMDALKEKKLPNDAAEQMTLDAIAKIFERAGEVANLGIKIHSHMMRHSCGYFLASQGMTTRDIQEFLGHKNIQHTVRYTKHNAERFKQINWSWEKK
ncbi:tyrosine-type recombinase/integrase [Scytonema sp. UIC 10036]|uniref:tyrosine-type recombinase/integrase n=1 Tax=Scytonema sp. UIC 10036 TaxID=2304196 RepID=UPI0012DA6A77|nr:tyrosine-type recombinase/integrase [Scytonema sp. UIC 10036]MUG98937.1 tyrosine-type recombinase/integrase [Scytonema sp. UIC 10036]